MTIVSSTGSDVGGLGTPALVSGNILRSFNGWLAETGDPSFAANFNFAINTFSADFAGVSAPADVRLFVYVGATLLSTVAGTVTSGQFTLCYSAPSITRVVIAPGAVAGLRRGFHHRSALQGRGRCQGIEPERSRDQRQLANWRVH